MKRISLLSKLMLVAVLVTTLIACSGGSSTEGNTKKALSAFVNESNGIVAFGNANLKDILSKTDYKNVPKLGSMVGGEVSVLETVIDFDQPVYYALEGPLDHEGTPKTVYAFLKVKNADSLVSELTVRGFDVEEKDGIQYCEDGDVIIGVKDNLGVVITKSGDFDGAQLMNETFAKTEAEISGGSVDEILEEDGDVVVGVNVASLYETSETDLEDLSEEKQKELKEMVAGSFVKTSFKFEDGAAIIETKNLFSDKLMERMFFNSDKNVEMIAKLGSGQPRMGLSVNIDMRKAQGFVNDFSPEAIDELASAIGGPAQLALMTAGSDGLAGLFTGQLGMLMYGEPDAYGATTPDFNFFVGLTPNGNSIGGFAKDFLEYSMEGVELNNNGLSGFSDMSFAPAGGNLNLPKGCENFGKSGISFFFNFDGINMDDWDLEGEAIALKVIDYVTIDYSNEGGRIYIKAKDGKENVLKQAMDVMVEEFSSEIGKMSF